MGTQHHIYCQLLWNDEVAHLVQILYLCRTGFVPRACRSITYSSQRDVRAPPLNGDTYDVIYLQRPPVRFQKVDVIYVNLTDIDLVLISSL